MTMETSATSASSNVAPGTEVEGDVKAPELDLEVLNERLQEAAANAATKAELEAVKRAVGHIPGLQSKIDAFEKTLGSLVDTPSALGTVNQRLDRLVASLESVLTPQQVAALQIAPRDPTLDAVVQRLGNIEQAVSRGQNANDDRIIDPVQAALIAQWSEAENAVVEYAAGLGITRAEIPNEVWTKAYQANPNDPSGGTRIAVAELNQLKQAPQRRAERADAAAGGAGSPAPGAGRTGKLTIETLRKMSREEVRALPQAEIDAALRAG